MYRRGAVALGLTSTIGAERTAMKNIAMVAVGFANGQDPNVNNAWLLITQNPAFINTKREAGVITCTLSQVDKGLTYKPLEWLQGKIEAMKAEFSITAEEYRHVKTAYSFSNLKEEE